MANNDGGQNSNTISSAPHKDVSPFRGGGALNEPKSADHRSRSLAINAALAKRQTHTAAHHQDSRGATINPKRDLSSTLHRAHTLTSGGKDSCQRSDCDRPIYRKAGPDKAYSSMDFYGRGYITEEDFLGSIAMQRIPFTREEVREYFKQNNMFCKHGPSTVKDTASVAKSEATSMFGESKIVGVIDKVAAANGMTFDAFKKTFFPQLFLINEDEESDDDRQAKAHKRTLKENTREKQTEIIQERLKKLEKILKDKFSNNWESVRKAFLDLDADYDGYITVEDILRHFGQEKGVNYNDLKKLVVDKDSKKQGKIGYTDFSKWVGNTIHQSEGFYFRHDSIKNPQFEACLQKNEQSNMAKSKTLAQQSLINENLEKTVLDKIKFQWKTLRKAFMDLNMEKSGQILPEELRFYFQHWGLTLTEEQFKYLFNKFDMDGDGKISYKDFQLTVGSEIHPAEGLYFRQDKPFMSTKIESCRHEKCWQSVQGQNFYCSLHQKLHQDECLHLFEKLFKHIKTKWTKFISQLKQAADPDDQSQIFVDSFQTVLRKFKYPLSEKDIQMLLYSFPGRNEGEKKRLNVSKLYDQRYNMMLSKIYKGVDVHDNDGEDDPVDQSGYTGQFYRPVNKQLVPLSEGDLVQIINKNNRLADVIRTIKEIDKQHNGFVTTTELDDILKMLYREELANKDLRLIMKKYASIQNRVLVDYKLFRDSMITQLKQLNSGYNYAGTESSLSPNKTILGATPRPYHDSNKKGKSSSKVYDALNKFLSNKAQEIKAQQLDSSRNEAPGALLNLKELAQRPKTRDPFNEPKRSFLRTDFNPAIQKSNAALNKTTELTNDTSILQGSFPMAEYQSRLKLKKHSGYETTKDPLDSTLIPAGTTDYSDYPLPLAGASDLKRAQSSHGYVGMRGGVSNLLNLRKRRQQQSGEDDLQIMRNLSQNISKTFIDIDAPIGGIKSSQDPYTEGQHGNTIKINHFLNGKRSEQINGNTSQSLYHTLSTASNNQVAHLKFKNLLKAKLQYEWKNIYRLLSVADKGNVGSVSIADFEQAIHQCGAFLSKEDIKKVLKVYSTTDTQSLNYQQMSQDLGMHQGSFNFMRSQHNFRQQNITKLRNLYQSSEKKRNIFNGGHSTTLSHHSKMSLVTGTAETAKNEVKDILNAKFKQFKDLVNIYQKKSQNPESKILPLSEFRSVLKGLGINLQSQTLQKFIVNRVDEDTLGANTKRSKSNQSFYATVGVTGIGIDVNEFLRFYV